MGSDRAQAHTLEAVAAGTILLAALVFASQAAAVTPLTASTSSQHIENQEWASVDGMLAGEKANGTLEPTVLLVNNSTGRYYGTGPEGTYSNGGPPSPFGATLNETWRDEGIAFNVRYYPIVGNTTDDRSVSDRQIVYMGEPTDSSVSASTLVTLYDDDRLYRPDPNGTGVVETNATLAGTVRDENDSVGLVNRDSYPRDPTFTVVRVEVTVWRM